MHCPSYTIKLQWLFICNWPKFWPWEHKPKGTIISFNILQSSFSTIRKSPYPFNISWIPQQAFMITYFSLNLFLVPFLISPHYCQLSSLSTLRGCVGDHNSSPHVKLVFWSCDTLLIFAISFTFIPQLCSYHTVCIYILSFIFIVLTYKLPNFRRNRVLSWLANKSTP